MVAPGETIRAIAELNKMQGLYAPIRQDNETTVSFEDVIKTLQ